MQVKATIPRIQIWLSHTVWVIQFDWGSCQLCVGGQIISRAIWNEQGQVSVNFLKNKQIEYNLLPRKIYK